MPGVSIIGCNYKKEMMKKSNVKTGFIVIAVMTLTIATVLAMAPISQAQAVGLKKIGAYSECTTSRPVKCTNLTKYRAEGGGRTLDAAKTDAVLRAYCPQGSHVYGDGTWGAMGSMYNNTWFYADIDFFCAPGKGPRAVPIGNDN